MKKTKRKNPQRSSTKKNSLCFTLRIRPRRLICVGGFSVGQLLNSSFPTSAAFFFTIELVFHRKKCKKTQALPACVLDSFISMYVQDKPHRRILLRHYRPAVPANIFDKEQRQSVRCRSSRQHRHHISSCDL